VVVIIFILCWCPLLTYNIIVAVGLVKPYVPHEYPYATHLNRAFSLLAYANSCLNPIVYGFMSRYFRKSFKQVKHSLYSLNITLICIIMICFFPLYKFCTANAFCRHYQVVACCEEVDIEVAGVRNTQTGPLLAFGGTEMLDVVLMRPNVTL